MNDTQGKIMRRGMVVEVLL